MAQLLVRDLEEDVKSRLRRRADRHGRSMAEEVREILRNAVRAREDAVSRLGSRLRDRFAGIGVDEDLPVMRGQKARPATFKK